MGFVAFTERAARARNVDDLASALLDKAGDLVGARAVGLYLIDGNVIHSRGVPTHMLDKYERLSAYDLVFQDVKSFHAPCAAPLRWMHDLAVKRRMPDAFIDTLDPTIGRQYMVAPVISAGAFAGTIHFARAEDVPFGVKELMTASAIALHLSTRLAAIDASSRVDRSWEGLLTKRRLEVADLAVRGFTAPEIGRALGISSNTVKKHLRVLYERLGVASRAELATILTRRADRV